jgi:membrane-bound lytic murein transglycosylase A
MHGWESALWRWQHARAAVSELNLNSVPFGAITGWAEDDHRAAFEVYLQSAERTDRPLPPAPEVARILKGESSARLFFERTFSAYRVVAEPGLLTSYFEPVLKGSRKRSATFPVPVYRRPADLQPLPQGDPLTALGLTAGRVAAGGFEPFVTRGAIGAGALEGLGLEILYLADPIEAFIMHVQGSGLVELDDGTAVRLTFDGKNGHPYTSIAKLLVERGDLAREDAHLEGMIGWLRAQPDVQTYLNNNKSYIFFRELDRSASAPRGSSGAELRAGRSLAADPFYHAPGTLIWVAAPQLVYEGASFERLLVVHDTGSAITGPQRGDVFGGMGAYAGRVAGRIRHTCEFIVLRPGR